MSSDSHMTATEKAILRAKENLTKAERLALANDVPVETVKEIHYEASTEKSHLTNSAKG